MNVSRWSPATRHAVLLALVTAVTYVTSVVVPQMDGTWLLVVEGACLVAGAVLTPLVQGYGAGQPPVPRAIPPIRDADAVAHRVKALSEWERDLIPMAPPIVPGAAGTEPRDGDDPSVL